MRKTNYNLINYGCVLGGHHAWVPEEEVRRTAYSYLPLRPVPLPLRFHQDLSKSQRHQTSTLGDVKSSIPTSHQYCTLLIEMMCFPPSPLHSGRHVLWRHFYQPGSWAEHLPCCCHTIIDYCIVHRHRFVRSGCIRFLFHRTYRSL